MTIKSKIIKFISAFLVISILLPTITFSYPKKAEAIIPVIDTAVVSALSPPSWISKALHAIGVPSTVTDTLISSKTFLASLLSLVLKTAAKAVLAKMTQATINWINSDFHGSPLFIENPGSFFNDIAKSEVRRLVDMIGYDSFRFPYGQQIALNIINSYKRQLSDNAQYTLSKVINDPDLLRRYRNDFNYAGWNGFLVNTQYPQNNYIGFESTIMSELARKLEGTTQAPAQKIQSLLQQGMGFLSPQTCPSNPKYNNGVNEFLKPSYKELPFDVNKYPGASGSLRWTEENNVAKAKWSEANTCPGGLVSTTPGSVAANQITTAMNMPYLTTALDGAFGNSLAAIFDALLNHFLDKGLNALSETVSSSPSNDNWSYNGNTLSGPTTSPTSGVSTLRIPQNVNATVGQVTSTMIYGGTAPYRIQSYNQPNPSIATTQISVSGSSGPTLTVTGVAPGQTTVVVEDSSNPVQSVKINIAINAIGDLIVTPHDISTDLNNPVSATISGGQEPYTMRTRPSEAVAIADFAGANLIVSGIEKGNTSIVIEDSSFPVKKTATIKITISSPGDLVIPKNITINVGQVTSIPILGGTGPFMIMDQQDVRIANGQIFNETQDAPSTLKITGVSVGEVAILIKDSSSPLKISDINITVIDNRTLKVTPQDVSANVDQTTSLTISGGEPNYSIDTPPDSTIATAQILGSNIIVTGKKIGQTNMIVRDSSSPIKTVTVPIVIGALTVTPQSVTTTVGQTTVITITGGLKPYSIDTTPDTTMVNAQIDTQNNLIPSAPSTLTIIGKAKGQTGIIVKDNSMPPNTTGIQITVN